MATHSRRSMIQLGGAALAAQLPELPLKVVGNIKPRPSSAIRASAISLGFETLDRRMFDPERTYGLLGQSGVKWARCQTGWSRTERVKGEYDFRWLDGVIDSVRRQGVQPWFSLSFGNKLYVPEAPHESAVGWHPMRTPEAREAWLRFTRAAAARYRDRVKHWEIWNEPNLDHWWMPHGAKPAEYTEMVRITVPEIKQRIPDAVIVGGALAGGPARHMDYLEACLDLGLGKYVDKIAYHPYRGVPEDDYENEVRALRALVARHRPGIGVWQGENGCPSQNGSSGALRDLDWNEARQARWLLRRLLTDIRLDIELTSYFHTVDMVNYFTSDGKPGPTNFKGVIRGTDYTPKPSYHALQSLCALFDSDSVRADFLLLFGATSGPRPAEPEAIQRATFLRGGRPLYAYWYPASPQSDFPAGTVTVTVRHGKAARLDQPVLADLLTGKVHEIAAQTSGGSYVFSGLPLTDYPLVITDRAVTG